MTSKTALDAIHPHAYGLKAAAACDPIIDQLFTSTDNKDLSASIQFINENIKHADDRDRAMQALITFAATGDREAAAQVIKGYEYLAAHLHLGKHMHALRMIDQMDQVSDHPTDQIDEMPAYPVRAENYQPAATCIIETLTESIQASNAPSAAISAATISI
jgi:hypothetical protein